MFLKKIKLIAYAFLKILPQIDIEVADGIVDNLRKFPQLLYGFFNYAHWK